MNKDRLFDNELLSNKEVDEEEKQVLNTPPCQLDIDEPGLVTP